LQPRSVQELAIPYFEKGGIDDQPVKAERDTRSCGVAKGTHLINA